MIKTYEFWMAVAVALIVKIKTSKSLGPLAVLTTIAVAVGAAWVWTDWVMQAADIPEPVAAALVALTAEGVMRWILLALDNPREAIVLWREWWRK